MEWYFEYQNPQMDLNCEESGSRDGMCEPTRYALEFFRKDLPLWSMRPVNDLAADECWFVFAREGDTCAVYPPEAGRASTVWDGRTHAMAERCSPVLGRLSGPAKS